jgi:hypothetical protein
MYIKSLPNRQKSPFFRIIFQNFQFPALNILKKKKRITAGEESLTLSEIRS